MAANRTLLSAAAFLLLFLGILLAQYTIADMSSDAIPSIGEIMAHWPQLQQAPSLKGLRGEVGGMPLPDGWSIGKLPKAGLVWPCGDDEAARICYVMADGSKTDVNKMVDMAKIDGKYMFLIQKGGGK